MEAVGRFSSVVEPRRSVADISDSAASSALRVLVETATSSREGFRDTVHWLCLCVRSGVDISVSTFMHLASLAVRFNAGLAECSLLVKAVLWSTWLRSVGRQELQSMITKIHDHLAEVTLRALRMGEHIPDM